MKAPILALTALLLFCAIPRPASAESPGDAELSLAAGRVGAEIVFSAEEIRIIRAYYESGSRQAPPGRKGGHKALPPGIAKNLQRGKPLPPGIAKQVLPGDLERRLPGPPEGYERIIVDGKILLIEVATRIIRDVLTDILIP